MKKELRKELYEGMYILSATLSDDSRKKAFDKITDGISQKGGEIHKIHEQGRRKLAYEIDGKRVEELPSSQSDFHHAKPIYEYLPGWTEDISGARSLSDLPKNAQSYVKYLEEISGAPMSAIGVGPGRDQTIVVKDFV